MTSPPREKADPILSLHVEMSLSAEPAILKRIAKNDPRVRVVRGTGTLSITSKTPDEAMLELRKFAQLVKSSTNSERV